MSGQTTIKRSFKKMQKQIIIFYVVTILLATLLSAGNVLLKMYNYDKASLVLQPINIFIVVGW